MQPEEWSLGARASSHSPSLRSSPHPLLQSFSNAFPSLAFGIDESSRETEKLRGSTETSPQSEEKRGHCLASHFVLRVVYIATLCTPPGENLWISHTTYAEIRFS